MKKIVLIVVSAFVLIHSFGQKLDSIKYANGYLYYHGYGNGEPIILLSGGPGASWQQEEEVAIELSKNYRAIILEQRGTGRSIPIPFDSTTINLKAALEDLNLLLSHLHLKEAIFYGHSWGGMLAMSFATYFPKHVKALIITGTGPFKSDSYSMATQNINIRARLTQDQQLKLDSIQTKRRDGNASEADENEFKKIYRYGRIVNHDMEDSINSKLDAGLKSGEAARQKGSMSMLIFKDLAKIHYDLTPKFSAYKKPFFAICGRQDPGDFVTYELKIAVPRVELYWIQSAGHFPMFEQPEEFYKLLNALVEKGKKHP